jgi:sugar O-acyltransferase (sialic acid O-acetyltransferase NeuD family)
MNTFAIYSAGGFAREIKTECEKALNLSGEPYKLIFIDDIYPGQEVNGLRTLSYEDARKIDGLKICIALSSGRVRKERMDTIRKDGIGFFSIVANSVIMGDDVSYGDSCIFTTNSMVTCNAKIGDSFHCNIYSYVAHDCAIGDFVTFAPRVSLNGRINVGDFVYVGSDATFLPGTPDKFLTIGEGAVIGAGAVVTKDVAPYTTVVGSPAKPLPKKT